MELPCSSKTKTTGGNRRVHCRISGRLPGPRKQPLGKYWQKGPLVTHDSRLTGPGLLARMCSQPKQPVLQFGSLGGWIVTAITDRDHDRPETLLSLDPVMRIGRLLHWKNSVHD